MGFRPKDYDLHINFPGGVPIDGPSAGISIATAIVSAIRGIPVDHRIAMTGEMSIHGKVKPIGGVLAKVEAAIQAGAKKIIIPAENWLGVFEGLVDAEVIAVDRIEEVLMHALSLSVEDEKTLIPPPSDAVIASSVSYLQADSSER